MINKRPSLSIILHSITGFIVLIVFLIIANLLVSYIHSDTYLNFIEFFNSLLWLFFILFLIGMINSLFWNFDFPMNILAPITGGILGLFIVNLVYNILEFTQTFFYFDILENIMAYPISTIVFFATLIIGYLIIINEAGKGEESNFREEKHLKEDGKKKKIKEKKEYHKPDTSWDRVGDEFRRVFLNIGKALNRAFDGKKKKKKR